MRLGQHTLLLVRATLQYLPAMHFVSKLTPEQWADVRRLRAEGASYTALAERFGVKKETISARARKEGWLGPSAPAAGAAARRPRSGGSAATQAVRASLVRRLHSINEIKVRILELRMQKLLADAQQGKEISPAEWERTARDFADVIKSIDQVTEIDSDAAPAAGGGTKSYSSDALARASQADDFRREIADRIEKLIPPS